MFSSADRVIRDILASIGDGEAKGYAACRRQLLRSVQDLKAVVFHDSTCSAVKINEDLTIDLPSDCATPLRLWVDTDKGPRYLGRLDDTPVEALPCECDEPEDCSSSILQPGGLTGSSQSERGGDLGGWCSDGHNYYRAGTDLFENGRWRVDAKNARISLTSGRDVFNGNTLTLLYKSVSDKDELTLIPDAWYEAIRCHVLWTMYQAKNPGLADMFRRTMKMHIDNAKMVEMDKWSSRDLIAALKSNNNVA